MIKNKILQYLLGIVFAMLTIVIVSVTAALFPNIGWHFLTVLYISVIVLQIAFYILTTNLNFYWSILSFLLNFVLWVSEQVIIEKRFHDSFLYKDDYYQIGALILGALLWVSNKILIELLINFISKQDAKSIVKER